LPFLPATTPDRLAAEEIDYVGDVLKRALGEVR